VQRHDADSGLGFNGMLTGELLPMICNIAGNVFVFQQDSAQANHSHDTTELLHCETLHSLILT